MFRNKIHQRSGFTLIELIVVLAILAIVAAIAVPTAFSGIEKARIAACNASIENLTSKMRQDATLATMGEGTLSASEANDIITAVVADCGGTVYGNGKTTGFCSGGGEYTIAYDTSTGIFTITCSEHGLSSSQQAMQKIADWLTNYNSTHGTVAANNPAGIITAYCNENGKVPLTEDEVQQIFGDLTLNYLKTTGQVDGTTYNGNIYLRPLPVVVNGELQDVQYVTSSTQTNATAQTYLSYAIIVNGTTYVHYKSQNAATDQLAVSYWLAPSNSLDIATACKANNYTSVDDFVAKITANGYFVPLA